MKRRKQGKHLKTTMATTMMAIAIVSAGFFLSLGYQIIGPGEGPGAPGFDIDAGLDVSGGGDPPELASQSPPGTKEVAAGSTVTLSATWTDDAGLKSASLYTDESGEMAIVDTVDLEGTEDTSSFSYEMANLVDWSVKWKITATDTDLNSVSTPEGTLTTKDVTAPDCTLSQESDTPEVGATNVLTAICTDGSGVEEIVLITDESGNFEDIIDSYGSPAATEGLSASAEFEWLNKDIEKDKTISWKVKATDVNGNSKESGVLNFVVGGGEASDTEAPVLETSPEFETSTPYEDTSVDIDVSFTDNEGLKTIWLEVNGKKVLSKDVSGTSAEATLSWTPTTSGEATWRVFAEDAAGNVYSTDEFTFNVLAAPTEIQCDLAGKPDIKTGLCRDIGGGVYEQTVITYTCDTSTGTWKQVVGSQSCTVEVPTFAPLSLVIAALIIMVGIASTYFLVLRKPTAPKAGKA